VLALTVEQIFLQGAPETMIYLLGEIIVSGVQGVREGTPSLART
jgi:hypothetical protein